MMRQIKKQAPVFISIVVLFVLALGVGGYILTNQRFYLPAWFPLVGTDFYEVNAELQTAQAVVPGQGQTVNIAGVKVGDVGDVTARERPRGRPDEHQGRVQADLQGRDDPAAPEDRPQGHVPGARSRHRSPPARSTRAAPFRWPTRCRT